MEKQSKFLARLSSVKTMKYEKLFIYHKVGKLTEYRLSPSAL